MRIPALVAALLALSAGLAQAGEFDAALSDLAKGRIGEIATNPAVIAAIKKANEEHKGLEQGAIDELDAKWRAEVGGGNAPLIDAVTGAAASHVLVGIRDASEGLFTEIIVMDDRGLNAAVSDVTSDYWQGDEAKWQKTYAVGPDAVHIGDVELDESSQTYQAQVSITVKDPDSGAPIGAITVGVNVEQL